MLYRHFASKRDLWLACLDVAWDETRAMLREKIATFSGTPASGTRSPWRSPQMPNLWIQGLTEAGEDAVVRRAIRRHMREVHDFVADEIRRGQEAGTIPADRDANAEAWVFIGGRAAPLGRATGSAACSARATSRRSRASGSAG